MCPPATKRAFASEVHFNIKDDMTVDPFVTNRRWSVSIYETKRNLHVGHFFGYGVIPKCISIGGIYLDRMFNGTRNFKAKFEVSFMVESL